MHLPTPLPTLKTPVNGVPPYVPILAALVWVALGAGYLAGLDASNRVKVPQEAYKLARANVEAEMRAACSPWFTDKRGQVADKRIVVCKAPEFLIRVNP